MPISKVQSQGAKLVPGSLYTKENYEFLRQIERLSRETLSLISNSPDMKRKPVKGKAKQLHGDYLPCAWRLAIDGRKGLLLKGWRGQLKSTAGFWVKDSTRK
jgi:hypothetical protein